MIPIFIENPDSIFVIEDAENIVLDRERNGNSSVSALLNISDGLLSDCLNIQIICSFNTDVSKIDNALLRKGRLIAKYDFQDLEVEKARPPAKIIINSRTGTIVISGDVKVMPAAVAHGSLKVTVKEDLNVEQADALAVGAGANAVAGPPVQNPDTEIEVEEDVAKAFLFGQGVSLNDLVDSINAVGASSSDLVAILEALREAGALNAELIVI